MNYIPHKESEIRQMLETIGVGSIDELFKDIPDSLRYAEFDLPPGLAQLQLIRLSHELARKNKAGDFLSFLGAGAYEHHIPAIVKEIVALPGFLTSYTPYQSEASQGTLETIFDFQRLVCQLSGMELSNASMYDGPTALAEAVAMALLITRRKKVLAPKTLNPFWLQVLKTLLPQLEIEEIPYCRGICDPEALLERATQEIGAIILQQPNFFGCLEETEIVEKIAHRAGALLIGCVNPVSLGILKRPADWNADIVVAEGQPLGIPLNFGGAYLGLFATRMKWIRQMPGRLVGKAQDKEEKDAYTLISQTREQHIRRERATSNICTNSNLNAAAFTVTLFSLGSEGLRRLAHSNFKKAHYLQERICQIPGFNLKFPAPFFNEFVLESEMPAEILRDMLLERGIIAGLALGKFFPELKNCLLFCVTETKRKKDLDNLVNILSDISGKKPLRPAGAILLPEKLDERFLQGTKTKPKIPKITEQDLRNIFQPRSEKNFSVDTHFIPFGSCTMKLSPKEIEEAVKNWRFQSLHPLTPTELNQGTLQILYENQKTLSEICGMFQFSLQPAAGAHGELTGLLIAKAYHQKQGNFRKDTVLIPETAHGTNPASASKAGFRIVQVNSTPEGETDLEDLTRKVNEKTAVLMITVPNTLGLFERKIIEIAKIVHDAGALVYLDGANMNALLGIVKPGGMGIDIMHLNLHKTFSAPHGGGGPGSGPIGVVENLVGFLPVPVIAKNADGRYYLRYDLPDTIGRVSGFHGNIGVVLRAYFYLRALGKEDLGQVSRFSVLNANYLRQLLKDHFLFPYQRTSMHEFVLKLEPETATNVAKRILDYGFHAPTVSFPFPGALMIEPTETESKETLDKFASALLEIQKELKENPDLVANAPHTTPVKRINQTMAERDQIVKRNFYSK